MFLGDNAEVLEIKCHDACNLQTVHEKGCVGRENKRSKTLTTGETKRKVLENAGASIQIMPQFHQSELKQEALEVQSDKTDSSWQIPLKPKNLTILF